MDKTAPTCRNKTYNNIILCKTAPSGATSDEVRIPLQHLQQPQAG
jgi:hypothetical protein